MSLFGKNSASVDVAHAAAADGAVLVDVRTAQERKAATPAGSIHIPLDALARKTSKLEGRDVYVICRSGQRSARAARYLRAQGIEAKNVKGGMLAWQRSQLPVTTGAKGKNR